jgi:serine/threonine protein kinase
LPTHFSPELSDLISKLIVMVPTNRIGIDKILAHPWLKASIDYPVFNSNVHRDSRLVIDEKIVEYISKMGFPKIFIINSLKVQECNHATAAYVLLTQIPT